VIHSGAAHAARDADVPRHRDRPSRRKAGLGILAGPLPLAAVLVIQAALGLRLIWSNTAFQDEALYLWAGHLELSHLLNGAPIASAFQGYFSGAPVIYPALGAVADSAGGLAAARLLSLCFMLISTGLLWSATKRLFDPRSAIIAAAMFAGAASVQFMSALATYDAMALMLLAAAAWCALRSGDCRRRSQVMLLVAMVVLLVLANATKYGSLLWDPVVVALAALTDGRYRGWLSGLVTGIAAIAGLVVALLCVLLVAGPGYWDGIMTSTLNRPPGPTRSFAVLQNAGYWIGAVAVLALVGAVVLTRARPGRARALIGWTLFAAVLLAPIEQARIHTNVSLFKHVGYGGWFAAIIAGYGIATLSRPAGARIRRTLTVIAAAALATLGVVGAMTASHHYDNWENTTALTTALRPLVTQSHGPSLAEEPAVLNYYFRQSGTKWSNTFTFEYYDRTTREHLTGLPAYAAAIRHHYFALVIIGFTTTTKATDQAIENDVRQNPSYRLMASVPWVVGSHSGHYLIWRYQPAARRK